MAETTLTRPANGAVQLERVLIEGDLSALSVEEQHTVIRRILKRLVPNPTTGCWEWQGAKTTAGYGLIQAGHITVAGNHSPSYVHRLSYEFWHGPIPDGLVIDHLCRNPACSHPDHLEAVTQGINCLRGNGLSARYARATHCVHGHPKSEVVVRAKGRRECGACRRESNRAVARARRARP